VGGQRELHVSMCILCVLVHFCNNINGTWNEHVMEKLYSVPMHKLPQQQQRCAGCNPLPFLCERRISHSTSDLYSQKGGMNKK